MQIKGLILASVLSCGSLAAQPNILLITADDHGVEMGAYGYPGARTPNLDNLARMGVQFNRAYVTQASCSPSRSSILTGLYPHQNGQIGLAHEGYTMTEGLPNLVGELKKEDYMTAIIGKLHVSPKAAFPFDVDHSQHAVGTRDVGRVKRQAADFIKEATVKDRPFFLYVNYFDPHRPYNADAVQLKGIPAEPHDPDKVDLLPYIPIDSPDMRRDVATYYNAIERLDVGVGQLISILEESDLLKDTIVIYVGDHGSPFPRAKTTCYEAGVRIPYLIYQASAAENGSKKDQFVSTVDLMPTILEIAGIPIPEDLAGHSLVPILNNKDVSNWRTHIATEYTAHRIEHYYPRRSIRNERYKLILNLTPEQRNPVWPGPKPVEPVPEEWATTYKTYMHPPEFELYDLQEDPFETSNLSDDPAYKGVLSQMKQSLLEWREDTDDQTLDAGYLNMMNQKHRHLIKNRMKWSSNITLTD